MFLKILGWVFFGNMFFDTLAYYNALCSGYWFWSDRDLVGGCSRYGDHHWSRRPDGNHSPTQQDWSWSSHGSAVHQCGFERQPEPGVCTENGLDDVSVCFRGGRYVERLLCVTKRDREREGRRGRSTFVHAHATRIWVRMSSCVEKIWNFKFPACQWALVKSQ